MKDINDREHEIFGKLVGVGLGPGDPELMTLKAVRHIQQADVITYPAAEGIPSFARSIAAEHIRQNRSNTPWKCP